jgi:hypothetical protein
MENVYTTNDPPRRISLAADARELIGGGVVVLAVAYALDQWLAFNTKAPLPIFDLFGYGVAIWRISRSKAPPLSAGVAVALCGVVALGALGPYRSPGVALTVLAVYCGTRKDSELRTAGALLFALAVHELWSRGIFAAFAPEFVRVDAGLVGSLVKLTHPDAVWNGNMIATSDAHAIVIEEGCSSFANVSLAVLCWLSMTTLERSKVKKVDLLVVIPVIAMQIFLNVARIYLMALSPPMYEYWHNGLGAQIYANGASVLTIGMTLLGLRLVHKP